MFKKLTYAVTISALAALSLATVASASGPYASFTIANGDPTEEVQQTSVTVEHPVRLNVQAGDDNDKSGAVLDYTNFTIANGDANEENSNDVDTKVQAAITVEQPVKLNVRGGDDSDFAITTEQPSKLNIGGGDDSDMPSINVGSEPVKLNIGGGDDNDMPRVRLHVGASDPAEQAYSSSQLNNQALHTKEPPVALTGGSFCCISIRASHLSLRGVRRRGNRR
jgi:hypothetical protein